MVSFNTVASGGGGMSKGGGTVLIEHLIPYAVYFLGPLVLAFWLGKRVLQARWAAFGFGLVFFFAAWICVMLSTQIPAAVFPALATGTFFGSILASIGAGFFEEAARWMAFRFLPVFGRDRRWQSGIMYAIGHSGMESVIVGGGIVLTYAVVTHAPQVLDAEMLEAAKETLQAGLGWEIYGAFERLLIGLLLHACFSLVVLLGVVQTRGVIVLLAMLWHFAHDMIAFNLHYLGDHWTLRFGFVAAILLVYGWALFHLVGAFPPESTERSGRAGLKRAGDR